MLKIKKQLPLSVVDESEYTKHQEDIKNSIKKLFISNKDKKKTIDEYAQLTTQIREEYAKLQAKCVQLEKTLQKYKDYVEHRWSPSAPPPNTQRKRVFRKQKIPYYHDNIDRGYMSADERDNNEDEYYDYESKPKPKRKKRIVYVDEIDGDDDDDDNEEEEPREVDDENDDEEYIRVRKKKKPVVGKKVPSKETKKKIGITKSI